MSGWIKLHRKIWDNPIITKDSEYLAVWIYLLTKATYKEKSTLFKGEKITLHPGQLITGRKVISDATKVHESKVLRILKAFEKDKQIHQEKSNKGTLVTILNWSEYQEGEDTKENVSASQSSMTQITDEQSVNNKCTSDKQPVNTFEKKEKNRKSKKSIWMCTKEASSCTKNSRSIGKTVPEKSSNKFHNFEQREYSADFYDLLEAKLFGSA